MSATSPDAATPEALTAPVVIAVDGPAAAGKGTLARRLAAELGLPYLDTGLLYRAVARRVLLAGGLPTDPAAAEAAARNLLAEDLQRGDLRGPDVDQGASQVAAQPPVRAALLDFQRSFAARHGGVMDGRDIGTVVCPDARVKLFVTASPEARARRRWLERQAKGEAIPLEEVAAEMAVRDARDAARDVAPMKPADDAVLLDTTELDAEAAYRSAWTLVQAKLEV
ncbi:(d)CMP kinase [Roseomonas sp. SSH11]|uniref:Cytidylate kinase n=1 Tax=Pararoseomonas baculiformis TaxID=2820812 RepID=A0ABS4ACA1_9PROT|nr:d(CMP) kinase [Pararoseomonas baculiformis]MBP0444632.1 (d)CMP kinase [Pararoseomonas baculiformis]